MPANQEESFKRAKLRQYTDEELAAFADELGERVRRLNKISASYNGAVSKVLDDRSLDSTRKLAHANHYGLRRDVANEMSDAASKDVAAIEVELEFRKG